MLYVKTSAKNVVAPEEAACNLMNIVDPSSVPHGTLFWKKKCNKLYSSQHTQTNMCMILQNCCFPLNICDRIDYLRH